MKTAKHILYTGLLCVLTACVTLYKPNAIHSPMLREKGELNASASLGLSGCGLYNLQAAYAISDHTGVMIDAMYHNRHSDNADSSVERLNMVFAEAGVGYFTKFSNQENGLFQCYGGVGYGFTTDKMNYTHQPYPEVNAHFFNLFIQPGVVYHSEYFDMAFDLRTNYVRLFNIHGYLYDQFEWWNTDFKFYSDTTLDFINIEPAITFKAGGKRLKGVLQFGVTIPAINSSAYFHVNSSSMLIGPLFKFSLGVTYTFGKKSSHR
jgi:hypothetical protein